MRICIYIPITKIDFLDETFSSVINQTRHDYDVLVMDNTINGHGVVKEKYEQYFGHLPSASMIATPHHLGDGDPTQSWNYGLSHIHADYFTLLGDDDALAPNYLEEMLNLMASHPAAPIYRCQVHMINEKGQITKYGQSVPETITWDKYIYDRKTYKFTQSTSEFCICTESINKIGGYLSYPYAICSDEATYITLMLSGEMVSTNKTYAYWRRHGNNLSMRVPYSLRIEALTKFYVFVQTLLNTQHHVIHDTIMLRCVEVNKRKERKGVIKKKLYGSNLLGWFIKKVYKNKAI